MSDADVDPSDYERPSASRIHEKVWLASLPLPPSTNALTRPAVVAGHARLVGTREAKAYRAAIAAHVAGQPAGFSLFVGPVRLTAVFTVPTIASDVSNRLKALEDALTGHVWRDDRQVSRLDVSKRIGPPSVHVTVQVDHEADPEFRARLSQSAAKASLAKGSPRRGLKVSPSVYP